MSTEPETTATNSQPEQQAPPKAQSSKKEKKKGKKCLPLEHLHYSVSLIFCISLNHPPTIAEVTQSFPSDQKSKYASIINLTKVGF